MFNISIPRAHEASASKVDGEPIVEIKTPVVLAQEAKAKLDELLKGSTEAEPAVGNDTPQLPMQQSGFYTPTGPIRTPPMIPRNVLVSNNRWWELQIL